jgi:hypothetical protein
MTELVLNVLKRSDGSGERGQGLGWKFTEIVVHDLYKLANGCGMLK